MEYTLKLINRPTTDIISMERSVLINLLNADEAARAKNLEVITKIPAVRHDKVWLEMIVNWVPKEGLPLAVMGTWIKIAEKVAKIKTEGDYDLKLSEYQVGLIWSRINDNRFIITGAMEQAFWGFLADFQEMAGKHFETEDPSKE